MRRCFTWLLISGLGEPIVWHQSVWFKRKCGNRVVDVSFWLGGIFGWVIVQPFFNSRLCVECFWFFSYPLCYSNTCLTINSPILKRILLHNLMRILHKSWEVFIKILIQIFYVLTWLGAGFYEIPPLFVNISYTSGGKEFFTSFIFLRCVFNSANKLVCALDPSFSDSKLSIKLCTLDFCLSFFTLIIL